MSGATLRDHPQFPYRAEAGRQNESWRSAFLDPPLHGTHQSRLLDEFIEKVRAFAFLERVLTGDVRYELPVHREILGQHADAREVQGESLAASELGAMECSDYPATELAERLEKMGIKVFAATSGSGDSTLGGACFFEGELGPALLATADPESTVATFVIAHEFGHLVADVNPYRSRCCRWDPATVTSAIDSVEERRADRFARSLLMPPALVARSLRDLGGKPRVDVLATLFAVPEAVVLGRLVDLEIGAAVPGIGERRPPEVQTRRDSTGETSSTAAGLSLPARFVQLTLGAWSSRLMERDLVELFLGLDAAGVDELIEWAGIERRESRSQDPE